jgi:peptidyl-prolyl cis-trans isomerase D
VYEQSDALKPVADRLKLEVKTATGVTRQPQPGTTGVLANAKFLGALFAPDAVEKKRNTEAVETAPSQLVSGRIVQYTPARTQPFAEVKATVRQRWIAERSAEEARKEGAARLAAWKASPAAATGLSPVVTVSRDQTQNLPSPIIDAALRADGAALPAWVGVDLGNQGYVVLKVAKLVPRTAPTAAVAAQEREQYNQWWTTAENLAYYNALKERFKAEILVPKPTPTARAGA